jgi:hypothetical protein
LTFGKNPRGGANGNYVIDQFIIYDTNLSSSEISSLYNSGSGTSTPSTTNLIVHYDFEQTGSTLDNQSTLPPTDTKLLSLNDVTFSVGTTSASVIEATVTLETSQTTSNDHIQCQASPSTEDNKCAVKVYSSHGIVGEDLSKVIFKLRNPFSSSSTYQIDAKVWDSSGTVKATSVTAVTLNQLQTSWSGDANKVEYVFSPPVTISANDYIGIEPQGGTVNVDSVVFRAQSSNVVSDSELITYRNGWGTVSYSSWDPYMITYSTVTNQIISATSLTDNTSTPHHYAFTRTSNDWTIYQDGSSVATATDSTSLGSAGTYNTKLSGSLDEFFIDSTSFSSSEIDTIYERGVAPSLIASPTLAEYDDSSVVGGTTYYYSVQAVNSIGSSNYLTPFISGLAGTPPSIPQNLLIIDTTGFVNTLTWDSPTSQGSGSHDGYELYLNGVLDQTLGLVNTITDTVSGGGLFDYTIKSTGTHGDSAVSSVASVTIPTVLTVTAISDTEIDLSWSAPITGTITAYQIEYESPTSSGWSNLVANTANTNIVYSATGLTTGTEYNFKVTSIVSAGTQITSNEASTNTHGILPAPVLDTVTRLSSTSLQLDWSASSGLPVASGYKIEKQLGTGWLSVSLNTGTTATIYTETGLPSGQEVTYRIYSINSYGVSPVSNEVISSTISSSGGGGGSSSTYQGGGGTSFVDLSLIDQIHRALLGQFLSDSIDVSWASTKSVEITSIIIADSPFNIVFQSVPFILIGDADGTSNGKIVYSIQIPTEFCSNDGQLNCIEEKLYSIPVEVKATHDGVQVTKNTVIKIDMSSATSIPFVFVLLAIAGVPIAYFARKLVHKGHKSKSRKASGATHKPRKNGSASKQLSL